MLLTDLLTVLIPRIDHSRVGRMFRQIDHIPLIHSYLIADPNRAPAIQQPFNAPAVGGHATVPEGTTSEEGTTLLSILSCVCYTTI
jgi:hypothetical protein